MSTETIIKELYPIYTSFKDGDYTTAKKLFLEMKILDTETHLSQPNNIRHLIWNLYEFLVLDNLGYTDEDEIMKTFKELFETNTV